MDTEQSEMAVEAVKTAAEVGSATAKESTTFWSCVPMPDKKLLVVAGSALGIGVLVGGTGMFLYRRWNDRLNNQVEVLSKSLGDVYSELRSLQQGMVVVQQSISQMGKEPEDEQPTRRRRTRRMQFYDSDSEESSVYFSAAEDWEVKRPPRSILKRPKSAGSENGPNGHISDGDGRLQINGLTSLQTFYPESPLASPSDDEEYYEDAVSSLHDVPSQTMIFEREFERGDLKRIPEGREATPFEEMDYALDSSVSNEQVIAAMELIQSKEQLYPNDAEYLWRLSKAIFIYANQCVKRDRETRVKLIKQAKEHADAARKLLPSHPDVLKWSALTTGGLARYSDKTQKLSLGLLTRQFLQAALDIRPNDASLHHILGRWNFEISKLGWFEKTAAKALFGSYANVSYEDAKKCFLEAERLKPKMFKSNMFYVAKCFALQGNKEEARQWLDEALKVQRLCVEDELCDVEIEELMATL